MLVSFQEKKHLFQSKVYKLKQPYDKKKDHNKSRMNWKSCMEALR